MMFFNEDWIHHLMVRYETKTPVNEKTLKEYIYSFKNTQVTDFMLNVNGTMSTADSKVFETFADKYLLTEDNGVPGNFKDTCAKYVYDLIKEQKVDMYKVWIDALKEIGINPWLSIRMNDCHGNMYKEANWMRSTYVNANPDYHIASHRERIGYFDKCFDYAKEPIRKKMLDYIDEMLARYDVYGLELDMMRDFFFFEFGLEYSGFSIMKQFIEDVCKIKAKYEEKYAHKIKFMLVLPSTPSLMYERGVDIFDFIDEVDYITIIPRWETIDTDMPIELWKQLLSNTNVKLACGQQCLYAPYSGYKTAICSVQMAFGQAIANLSRGADFVYLYNYMDHNIGEIYLRDYIYEASTLNDENRPLMFNNLGKEETLLKQKRSHVVTYSDFWNYNIGAYSRLPIEFGKTEDYQRIKIPVGKLPEKFELKLILGIKQYEKINPQDIKAYVNAKECTFDKITKLNEKIYENECFVFNIIPADLNIMYAEIKISKNCLLEHVEIEVIPE